MPTMSVSQSQVTLTSEPEKFRNPSWWKRRTRLEKTLCFITTVTLAILSVIIATLAAFGYLYQKDIESRYAVNPANRSARSPAENICLTPGCVKTAAKILSFIDESVDPCTDFYRFGCGGWLQTNPIPDHKAAISAFSEVSDHLSEMLRDLLEKNSVQELRFMKMAKDLYNTCMDLKSIEKYGSGPLKKSLKNLGGWPVLEGKDWDDSKFDWVDSLIAFRKSGYGHYSLIDLQVVPDYKNNKIYTIALDQPTLSMDRTYLIEGLEDPDTKAYYTLMVNSAKLLGADKSTVESEMLKVLNFEIAMANYSLPQEERRNFSKLYNKYTVKELLQIIPEIPWVKYLNGLLTDEITENETVIVAVPDYLKNFTKLITQTEKRVVANYMLWRIVFESMPTLSKNWRDLYQEYISSVTGKTQESPRWKKCLNVVHGMGFGVALSSLYVRNYFKEDSKDAALELVTYIQKEFLHILENIDWMDEETKQHAKEKANAMKPIIGYPKELLNDTAVLEMYENLTITKDSYFENIRRLLKWSIDDEFSELRKPVIKGYWKDHAIAAEVNAYYSWQENIMEFPAGILQNIFFDKDRPNYMNFGAIGFIIGHEITHGFDDEGRQFDKDGNTVNWWHETTDEHFRKKAQCIIDQYNNYTAENGMKINGINTQGENIADNGGLKEAYWAYQSWVKEHGPELSLPGLKYTQNQLFWISAANAWCAKERPESLRDSIVSGFHSPDEFRVIGSMSNLEEFAKEFNCPPDSPMNKKPKCQIW